MKSICTEWDALFWDDNEVPDLAQTIRIQATSYITRMRAIPDVPRCSDNLKAFLKYKADVRRIRSCYH